MALAMIHGMLPSSHGESRMGRRSSRIEDAAAARTRRAPDARDVRRLLAPEDVAGSISSAASRQT